MSVGEEKLRELERKFEADLIRQEHRTLWVMLNAWNHWRGAADDPRRNAARQAVLTYLLFRPVSVAGGVSLIAVAGLFLAWQANKLVTEQNRLIERQNASFTAQNSLVEAQNKLAEAQNKLVETQNESFQSQNDLLEAQNGQIQSQNDSFALQNDLLTKQNELIQTQNLLAQSSRQAGLIVELTSVLDAVTREKTRFDIARARMEKNKTWDKYIGGFSCSVLTRRRIVALSRALKPYQVLDEKGDKLPYLLSPERGHLLCALVRADANEFSFLSEADFRFADLRGADVRGCNFAWLDLRDADFTGAQLDGARFFAVCLPDPTRFNNCTMDNTRLHGATVLQSDWLESLKRLPNPPKHFVPDYWKLQETNYDPDVRPIVGNTEPSYQIDADGNEVLSNTYKVSGITRYGTVIKMYRIRATEKNPEQDELPPATPGEADDVDLLPQDGTAPEAPAAPEA